MGLKSDKSESGVEKVGQKQMEVETVEANRYNILGWLKTDNISHGIQKQGPAASSKTDRRFILLAPSALRYPIH